MTAAPSKIVRHPRDQFNPANEFVFMKRLRFNLPNYEFSQPGDPVTPELRAAIGESKLKVWHTGNFIATKEYAIAVGIPVKPDYEDARQATMRHVGGGWYEVVLSSGEAKRVRTKKAAQALVDKDNKAGG